MNEEIKMIGEIDFRDIKVKIYNDPHTKDDVAQCVWRMRNPDTCYKGTVFMSWETGKMTYPEGAVIPEQTDKDREILPQFVIVGKKELDDDLAKLVTAYLEPEYLRKNKLRENKDEQLQ
jgi:hypothetical protein